MDLEFMKEDSDIMYIKKTAEQYRKFGVPTRMGFGKRPAVINVDIQYAFTSAESPVGGGLDSMVENTAKLLEEARNKKIPIYYTVVAFRDDGQDDTFALKAGFDNPSALHKLCRFGTKWIEADERVKPAKEDVVIQKKAASAFFMTNIIHLLTSKSIDTTIITGDATSGCVRATVVDSASYGFRTIVPEECVGDRAIGPHKASLFDMAVKYADVVRLQEVIDYRERDSHSYD